MNTNPELFMPPHEWFSTPYLCAGLGAFGVALQNYQAVALFLTSLTQGGIMTQSLIQMTALAAGGLCSGMVNFWMNVELLEAFFKRMNRDGEYQYQQLGLSGWALAQYLGGILVFVVTGILFGLMAFTFAMEGPLAILSVLVGIFVAGIMTIQEVETWLSSYDPDENNEDLPLLDEEYIGLWIGQIIAIGNVVALSLLFTLSLAEGLIALQIASTLAIAIGFFVAFTFGAFTEYYFYNFYLAQFCKNFDEKWAQMLQIPLAWFGILCVTTNALVNAALTYAGIELLVALLVTTQMIVPPTLVITLLTGLLALFAGSASFILGLDFWIRQNPMLETAPMALALLEEAPMAPPPADHDSTHKNLFAFYSTQSPQEKSDGSHKGLEHCAALVL